jgi:hypothetical protein
MKQDSSKYCHAYGATKTLRSIAGAPCIEMHAKTAANIAAEVKMIAALANMWFLVGKASDCGTTIKVDSRLDMTISF